LEFDQLNAIMKRGVFFDGFREAPINFPPTFKYDVSRRPKHRKRSPPGDQLLLPQADECQTEMAGEDVDEGTDVVSLASSVTTVNSRALSESGAVNHSFRAVPTNSTIASSDTKNLDNGKRRPKWLSLLSPSITTSPKFSKFQANEQQAGLSSPATPNTVLSIPPQPAIASKTSNPAKMRFLRPPPMILANLSMSQSTLRDETVEEEKGVYDTSSKKRVPSWLVVERYKRHIN
jgi:hypothetical protein